jgi:hypothetical protein
MSTNLGSISVGMNVDLATFEAGMKRATEVARSNTALMSAEMKRNSREGAESLRLFDEGMGIRISRPLTRLIGQTQLIGPALASAFQFSAAFALGSVIADSVIPKVIELTNAAAGWGEENQKDYKEAITLNQQFVKELERHKDALLEISHIGLSGTTLIKQLIAENTAAMTEEQAKIISLASQMATLRAGIAMSSFGETLTGKVAGSIPEIRDRMKELQKQLDETGLAMKRFGDTGEELSNKLKKVGAQEGIAQAKQAIREAQEEMRGWNEENNKAVQEWNRLNAEIDAGVAKLGSLSDRRIQAAGPGISPLPPPGAPQLRDQAELHDVTTDLNASWKKAGEVLESIETPAQRYATALAVLKELQRQGRITADQEAAAEAQLGESMTKAAMQVLRLRNEMQRLLENSTAAKDGLKAVWKQMQIDAAQNGKFTFDIMNRAVQGFEDNVASAIVTGKANWKSYFQELEMMAIKFLLNKALVGLLGKLGGGGGGGLGGLLSGLIPHASGGGVMPGQGYLVGENGPEPFFPGVTGTIAPSSYLGSSKGTTIQNFDFRNADPSVIPQVQRMIAVSEERSVARSVTMQNEISRRRPAGAR